ncbi:MAG: hypothetical protein H7X80_05250 [bacterium]|nr:hypothetical protein [Candidatus Kapabacteria bacterium]
MMNYRYSRFLYTALLFTSIIAACGDPIGTDESYQYTPAAEFNVRQLIQLSDSGEFYSSSISARFFNAQTSGVLVERVLCNDVELPHESDDWGNIYRQTIDAPYVKGKEYPRLYTFAVWGANGIPSLRDSIESRRLPELLSPQHGDTLDTSRDLVIRWVPDTITSDRQRRFDEYVTVTMSRFGRDEYVSVSLPEYGLFVVPAHYLRSADPGRLRIGLTRRTYKNGQTTDGRYTSFTAYAELNLEMIVR